MNGTGNWIDRAVDRIGAGVAWLNYLMMATTGLVVVLRYAFDTGSIFLQEAVLYMHALAFLAGISYTLRHDRHVRVDLFYSRMSTRRRTLVDLVGHLGFLLPLCIGVAVVSTPYAVQSWTIFEGSPEVGGVDAVFLLKSLIPLSALLLALQTLSLAFGAWRVLRGSSLGETS